MADGGLGKPRGRSGRERRMERRGEEVCDRCESVLMCLGGNKNQSGCVFITIMSVGAS